MTRLLLLILAFMLLPGGGAQAHELRPAYLAIEEGDGGSYAVFWKMPALGERRLDLAVQLPAGCAAGSEPLVAMVDAALTRRWTEICEAGLKGQAITIDGLQSTLTDVLVRISWLDGTVEIARLTPEAPSFVAKGAQSGWEVARSYFTLGVGHILSGYDHLVFVLALILLIRDRWMLVKTITAFTIAHSVTLAGASLGWISLPQKPVEAAIALSIAFLAAELVKIDRGATRSSERFPWLVAFGFGLLHGFGFAGALLETGLPQTDIPVALLTFNLGVEAGQLLFVAGVLGVFFALRALIDIPRRPSRLAAAYAIGTLAMVWLFLRLAGFGAVVV